MCKINCSGGCIDCAPEDHVIAVLRDARERILALKNSRWSEVEGSDKEWVDNIDNLLAALGAPC